MTIWQNFRYERNGTNCLAKHLRKKFGNRKCPYGNTYSDQVNSKYPVRILYKYYTTLHDARRSLVQSWLQLHSLPQHLPITKCPTIWCTFHYKTFAPNIRWQTVVHNVRITLIKALLYVVVIKCTSSTQDCTKVSKHQNIDGSIRNNFYKNLVNHCKHLKRDLYNYENFGPGSLPNISHRFYFDGNVIMWQFLQ